MTGDSPSHQLNDAEIRFLATLLNIIKSRSWKEFEHIIISNPNAFQSFSLTISCSTQLNGMTILHACVRSNPPTNIVRLLLALVPESLCHVDCLHRTPLHVAVGTRADLSVIQLLADAYPAACSVQDMDGKTPLHLACDSSCELFEGDYEKLPHDPPSIGVVFVLVRAWPWSVPLEDKDDTSALEYAILSDSSIEVVKLLQHATRTQCEKQTQQVMSFKTKRDESFPPL
ncbi:hypothetical protein ACHAW5_007868 [Stephanodiscus triporus]|uniref:Uncharacterized protein n=1 Tax=Stephanodiscus triporus TaxID=2934178 RepID=A0ABD3MDK3_9STRA